MSAYNTEKYIGEAIQSILNQTFTSFEFIIINDGSTDGTVEIIQSFSDSRIRLIDQSNSGIPRSLNTGIALAEADLIAHVDSDDIFFPQMLEKLYEVMLANPEYGIVGSNTDYMEVNGDYIFTHTTPNTHNEITNVVSKKCPFIHSGVMYRRGQVLKAGGYDVNAHSFQDHILWANLLKISRGHNIQEPLAKVRLNPTSMTIDERWRPRRFHQIRENGIKNGKLTIQVDISPIPCQ
ncbi:hypothetical protein BH09BAC3_BH09BAC3_26720 [soil metagenome]